MPQHLEWALIADAQRARIFEHAMPAGPWSECVAEATATDNPPSHEQGIERPGRVRESQGMARHAIEPREDPHRAAKRGFARQMADRLEAAAQAGRFARLLLVAPPAFLGDLRAALGDQARRRLAGSLDKDLTHLVLGALSPHLEDLSRAQPD